MTRVPGDVQEAREAFGSRLRELRLRASMTARALADETGLHFTKISRVEHGKQSLTDDEIRAWCTACGSEDVAADLIATARTVDSLYREWRRQAQAGLRILQERSAPHYRSVRQLRAYEHTILPGLLHTPAYSNELMAMWARFLGVPNDAEAATATRMDRKRILNSGVRRFAFLIAEQTLWTRVGDWKVMVEQLDHLLNLMSLPRLSVGVLPASTDRAFASQVSFWIWDDTRVTIETVSAELEITRKDEVALYVAAFDLLRQGAVYGRPAAALVTRARDEFRSSGPS